MALVLPEILRRVASLMPVALCLSLGACEDPFIDPFVEGKHFTVYGYISPFESEHFVRVIAFRRFP